MTRILFRQVVFNLWHRNIEHCLRGKSIVCTCKYDCKIKNILHDRSWISPWIKSIFNGLDITYHVIASQLSGHCDVISNRSWRHHQNDHRAGETRGRCVKIVVYIVICGFVMSRAQEIKWCMYSRDKLLLRSLECYFGVYFPRCFAPK